MSGVEQSEQSENRNGGELEAIIRDFLRHHAYLHEFRLQKLVYILDLVTQLKDGDRATEANFKPYMYGSYSEDLRETLENLEDDLPTERDYLNGKTVTKYLGELDEDSPESRYDDLIRRIRRATSGKSNTHLESWSKDSVLYEETEFDSRMDFDNLSDRQKSTIRKELIEEFPELKDVLTEEDSGS